MKAKKKRLWLYFTSFCVCVMMMIPMMPVKAEEADSESEIETEIEEETQETVEVEEDKPDSLNPLCEFNSGAAELLDILNRGSGDGTVEWEPSEEVAALSKEPEGPSSDIVMANVHNSLNVREEPSENAAKVGLLYADCGGKILETDGDWTKIQSGNLIGWASNTYLLFDEEAEALAQDVGRTMANIDADALRVRKEPSEEAGVWGLVKKGDRIEVVLDNSTDEWIAIEYKGEEGFISREYVTTEFSVDSGETLEEIKEREKRERLERAKLIADLGPVAIGATDETMLAALVYCEAGNQPYEGQLAVAAVVMNRVRSSAYPNSVAGVIYASGQFGPAVAGAVEARVKKSIPDACLKAAREAINGQTNVGGATHFRRWTGQDGIVIGAHVFW